MTNLHSGFWKWLTVTMSLSCAVTGQLTWIQLYDGSSGNVTNMTSYPPGRRDAVLSYDDTRNQLVLFGGSPGPLSDTWLYDLDRDEWREVNTSGIPHPPARYGAVGGVNGHHFYLATGRGLQGRPYRDVWRLDLRTEKWSVLPSTPLDGDNSSQPNIPSGRYFSTGGIYVTGSRLYVTMGIAHPDQSNSDATYAYDINSNTWYRETEVCGEYNPTCPHARSLHSGVMTGRDHFVIFSGCLRGGKTAGPCPSHDSWQYDGQRKTWTQLDNCPAPRLHSTMTLLPEDNGKKCAVLYGGQTDARTVFQTDDVTADQVAVLDLEFGSWTQRQTRPQTNASGIPHRRLSAAMATGPEGVFLFGGTSLHGVHLSDLWLLRGNTTDAGLSPVLPCAGMTVTMITIHGILMAAGFGFFLPLGALLMRHFRCLYSHVIFQILGLCCAIGGLALGVLSVRSSHFSFVHAIVGIVALGLGVLQPINAIIRPKEPRPEEKGVALRLWQCVHRMAGRVSIVLGLSNGSLGVFLAVASLPIIIAWHAWLGALLLFWLIGETVRYCRLLHGKRGTITSHSQAKGQSEGIINGWEKDINYINPTTETVRL